eukprot:scaffold1821_cov344-Pavlova_lutheri.AAC.18
MARYSQRSQAVTCLAPARSAIMVWSPAPAPRSNTRQSRSLACMAPMAATMARSIFSCRYSSSRNFRCRLGKRMSACTVT